MAEQLTEGPMIVEKQTALYVRRRGAPTRGAGGLSNRFLMAHDHGLAMASGAGLGALGTPGPTTPGTLGPRILPHWPSADHAWPSYGHEA